MMPPMMPRRILSRVLRRRRNWLLKRQDLRQEIHRRIETAKVTERGYGIVAVFEIFFWMGDPRWEGDCLRVCAYETKESP